MKEYSGARGEAFSGHPLAQFIRRDFRDTVAGVVGTDRQLICKGSSGQGNWGRGPWLGIFYAPITESAQAGYYPVYLFREDMQGVYLSLNQGMTEAKVHYKSDAKTALKAKAANFRAMLGGVWKQFPSVEIDLAPSTSSNDTAFYEAANICAKYYSADDLPIEEVLVEDLKAMLRLYGTLYEAETAGGFTAESVADEPEGLLYEDLTRLRMHARIERNAKLTKQVKAKKGCVCEVCNLDFGKIYGELGEGYIEAHHLRPLSTLKGQKVPMDPEFDFAVLCANCHRMIHRSEYISDVSEFRSKHFVTEKVT
ncbi:MrcB family domain-containing protein [Achromobacter insolitus]|uniref:MrcB family domain-containing protein n=1 Tax=Achromobacter insolitus TaxID=217204 RepID=UPI002FDDEF1B